MVYPTGLERIARLNRISERMLPQELAFADLLYGKQLWPFVSIIPDEAGRALPSDQLAIYLHNKLAQIPGPLQVAFEPSLSKSTQFTSFSKTQMWDYSFMLVDWWLEYPEVTSKLP